MAGPYEGLENGVEKEEATVSSLSECLKRKRRDRGTIEGRDIESWKRGWKAGEGGRKWKTKRRRAKEEDEEEEREREREGETEARSMF